MDGDGILVHATISVDAHPKFPRTIWTTFTARWPKPAGPTSCRASAHNRVLLVHSATQGGEASGTCSYDVFG
jgi:hypothetical protein